MYPLRLEVPVGGTLMLKCPLSSSVWSRDKNLSLPSTSSQLESELLIWKAELIHAGEYSCTGKDTIRTDEAISFDLVVYGEE